MSETQAIPGWRPMETAPRYGSCIVGRTRGGFELRMAWSNGFEDIDGNECGGWLAWNEGQHPKCWTDAVCWKTNEDGVPSDPPIGWMPMPEAPCDE